MPDSQHEIILSGIGVSHGIAMGPAYIVQMEHPAVPRHHLPPSGVTAELARFDHAVMQAMMDVSALKERVSGRAGGVEEEVGSLLDAHIAMLSGSRLIRGVRHRITTEAVNAEQAVEDEAKAIAAQFRQLQDRYIAARSEDVVAVGARMIRILMNVHYLSLEGVPPGGIVLARELTPADTVLMDPKRFGGLATVLGGPAGHTAVMARGMGLPAVLGVPPAMLKGVHQGMTVIVDGIDGKVILNPSFTTRLRYEQKLISLRMDRHALQKIALQPAVTLDGEVVELNANLETPRDLADIRASGARGIGLFRTEFMFMNRDDLPGEDEQFENMVEIVRAMKDKTVTFRTLDIGGDKVARAVGGYLAETENPALGLRAIRLSLKEPHLLRAQFRAMLRAAFFGSVRILLPLVTTAHEIERARAILKECHTDLKRERVPVPETLPPLGCMIEIPAAALSADSLAAVADFFAIGTNDLIQYTLAIDRGDEQVADLYNPLNPAVLRLMEFSIQAGLRAGIPVCVCGEMAADPKYTPLLLGLGIREMSVGYANVPRVKQRIRELTITRATEHARHIMDQYDPDRIDKIVKGFKA